MKSAPKQYSEGSIICGRYRIERHLETGLTGDTYTCLDLGSIGTTICYAAVQEGLGTIYLSLAMHYPDIVRKTLHIPETKKIVIGIALGIPHPDAPASLFRSEREPLDKIMRFA